MTMKSVDSELAGEYICIAIYVRDVRQTNELAYIQCRRFEW